MKNKKILIIIMIIGGIIILFLILNKINNKYESLSEEDQYILNEYNEFYESTEKNDIWDDYNLKDKTILMISKDSLSIYLVNANNVPKSLFATNIKLPDNFSLKNVYRISAIVPKTWLYKFDGNFNTIGKDYNLYGNDLYYVKYNKKNSIDSIYSSEHFITFLTHEAFHYYVQGNWNDSGLPSTDYLTTNVLSLMENEYEILNNIQDEMSKETPNKELLLKYAKSYVDVIDKLKIESPELMDSLLMKETIEGTATYVGIKASNIVGYDFGVMYFDNAKNVSFGDVFKEINKGSINKSFLVNRATYEVGSEISLLLDAIDCPNWQDELNSQTINKPRTLYTVLKEYINK